MKIHKCDSMQLRLWMRNAPVLVVTETGEAVMVDGSPRTATAEEIKALLLHGKKKKLFTVEHEGKPCHFVRGRSYLSRELARAYGGSVQVRSPNNQVLGSVRPKHAAHDIQNSECQPVELQRPHTPATRDLPAVLQPTGPASTPVVPTPDNCPICSGWAKPVGHIEGNHHFYCAHFKAYGQILEQRRQLEARKAREQEAAKTIIAPPPEAEPSEDKVTVLDLETGDVLREATPDEIAEARTVAEKDGMPIIDIGGKQYGIATENLT